MEDIASSIPTLLAIIVNLCVLGLQYKLKAEMAEVKIYMHENFVTKGR